MSNLQLLAQHLAHGVEVEHPAWQRGVLVGLPYVQTWERPAAHVRFAGTDSPTGADLVDLYADRLRPVLYPLADAEAVCRGAVGVPLLINTIRKCNPNELEFWASVVDTARALGFALNLAPEAYVRKEVARG